MSPAAPLLRLRQVRLPLRKGQAQPDYCRLLGAALVLASAPLGGGTRFPVLSATGVTNYQHAPCCALLLRAEHEPASSRSQRAPHRTRRARLLPTHRVRTPFRSPRLALSRTVRGRSQEPDSARAEPPITFPGTGFETQGSLC